MVADPGLVIVIWVVVILLMRLYMYAVVLTFTCPDTLVAAGAPAPNGMEADLTTMLLLGPDV